MARFIWAALFILGGFACLAPPVIAWFTHPELTQMQVFLAYWGWEVAAVVLLLIGSALLESWEP